VYDICMFYLWYWVCWCYYIMMIVTTTMIMIAYILEYEIVWRFIVIYVSIMCNVWEIFDVCILFCLNTVHSSLHGIHLHIHTSYLYIFRCMIWPSLTCMYVKYLTFLHPIHYTYLMLKYIIELNIITIYLSITIITITIIIITIYLLYNFYTFYFLFYFNISLSSLLL